MFVNSVHDISTHENSRLFERPIVRSTLSVRFLHIDPQVAARDDPGGFSGRNSTTLMSFKADHEPPLSRPKLRVAGHACEDAYEPIKDVACRSMFHLPVHDPRQWP